MRAEPVRIVAAGVVTPIGGDLDAFWSGLLTGIDGISTIERFPVDDLKVPRGGEIKKLPERTADLACRASRLLAAAADDLLTRAPLDADPGAGRDRGRHGARRGRGARPRARGSA